MKPLVLLLIIGSPVLVNAQLGIKAGLNFTNVTNVSSVNNQSSSGFNAGVFFATPYNKIMGSKIRRVWCGWLFRKNWYSFDSDTHFGPNSILWLFSP
jgi:hypothetical protein